MISDSIQKIIAKYFDKQATQFERDELESWLEHSTNYGIFKEYIKTNYIINLTMDLYDADDSKKQLLGLIEKEKKTYKLRRYYKLIRYAAVVVLFVGLGYLYEEGHFSKKPVVNIPPDSITLQLENGNIEIINENGTTQVLDAEGSVIGAQKGNQLVYNDDSKVGALEYNTLTVPFGKRFDVKLSDGTKVFLNAGTSLRYPTKFILGEKRQVFLTGEAFFDVASDTSHAFIVNTKSLNVEVLGTEFNMSAYPEDYNSDVVLVEGSVGMYSNDMTLAEGTILKPGVKGSFDKKHKKIATETVDISIYTSWMEGSLVFRNMPFKNIVKKLERRYNMKIVIDNEKLNEEIFNATFKNEPPIQDILNSFGKSYGIKHTIKNNAIFIN
jgi:ferric-dicitrate binding protein FerR (iron transport regulator)